MTSNAIATMNAAASQLRAVPEFDITREQIELIKRTVMPQASDLELDLFINLCRARRLDPLTKQIYAIKPKESGWQFFASIDGLRVIAQRSGEYLGQTAPFWCGSDGQWKDVWLAEGSPAAAKVGVWKRGGAEPTWGVATFRSYGLGKKNNWLSMPDVMLAKCAEAIALRKAFPDDLSGLYVREEFQDIEAVVVEPPVRALTDTKPDPPIDVDDETGEILSGQQALPAGIPANGTDMMDKQQRGRIMFLAGKLNWELDTVNAFAGEVTGLTNIDLLSQNRAAFVIREMEGQIPGKVRP